MATVASAKIYQFPLRGRFVRPEHDIHALTALVGAEVSLVPYDSWYHDEAVRAEQSERKN
jgi:hypothetical protein